MSDHVGMVAVMVLSPAAEEQMDCLLAWAWDGQGGRARARHYLVSHGLPNSDMTVDDVVQRTVVATFLRLREHGPLVDRAGVDVPVEAFASRVMRNLVLDELRAATRELLDVDNLVDTVAVGDDVAAGVESSESFTNTRRAVQHRIGERRPWAAAAALVALALIEEPSLTVRPEARLPQAATEDQVRLWAGLYYAGRDNCLPGDDGPDDVARRNRRALAKKTVDALLTDAGHAALAVSNRRVRS